MTQPKKKRGGNNNPTGKGGLKDNPQNRNTAGQRSAEVVATAAQARALYVQLLHEPHGAPLPNEISNLEVIVRQHVSAAKKGDAAAREQMFDRIWGRATQPVEMSGGMRLEIAAEDLTDNELAGIAKTE